MNVKKSNKRELGHFHKIPTSEISVEEDDIFYRKKYNEIINFFKHLLTFKANNNESAPNGLLLITSPLGTDILDYLKLISKNYYLDFYQHQPEKDFQKTENFPVQLLKDLKLITTVKEKRQNITPKEENQEKKKEKEKSEKDKEKKENKKLLIINESLFSDHLIKKKHPLKEFIFYLKNRSKQINLLQGKVILVWVNYDPSVMSTIGSDLFQFFDLYLKIPRLNESEQEIILNNFNKKHENIQLEYERILNDVKGWEVKDIKNLLKVAEFKYQINSEITNEKGNITPIIIDLIKSGEFFPTLKKNITNQDKQEKFIKKKREAEKSDDLNQEKSESQEKNQANQAYLKQLKNQEHSEFMINQLYEDAASKNYDDLLLIIEKIKDNEVLGENSRKILGKYPFILNEKPNQAQIKLEKAKKRIDQIRKVYKEG